LSLGEDSLHELTLNKAIGVLLAGLDSSTSQVPQQLPDATSTSTRKEAKFAASSL
jgi:hypothetical protein